MPDERINGKPRAMVAPGHMDKSDRHRLERVWPATGVVVGVDGSLSVLGAVSWAAAEAARRRLPLNLVHVLPSATGSSPDRTKIRYGHAGASLHRARKAVAAVAPGVPVTTATFATDAAMRLGVSLVPFTAGTDTAAAPARAGNGPRCERGEELGLELIAQHLAGYQECYPGLTIEPLIVVDNPVESLLEIEQRAQLIVIGSWGRVAEPRAGVGSMSQMLLRHSPCAVVALSPCTPRPSTVRAAPPPEATVRLRSDPVMTHCGLAMADSTMGARHRRGLHPSPLGARARRPADPWSPSSSLSSRS